jgi:hypothetical protein
VDHGEADEGDVGSRVALEVPGERNGNGLIQAKVRSTI